MGTTVIERLLDETTREDALDRLRHSGRAMEAGAVALAKEVQERLPDHLPRLSIDEDVREGLEQALRWPAEQGLPWPIEASRMTLLERLRGQGMVRLVVISLAAAAAATLLAYAGATLLRRRRRAARRAARRARHHGGNQHPASRPSAERERVAVAIEPQGRSENGPEVRVEEPIAEA
jgi:hypothetical protein